MGKTCKDNSYHPRLSFNWQGNGRITNYLKHLISVLGTQPTGLSEFTVNMTVRDDVTLTL